MTSPFRPIAACAFCSRWPLAEAEARRQMIYTLPLTEDEICERCEFSFWRNIQTAPATQH